VPPPHQRHPKSGRGGAAGTYLLPMGAWIHVRCADVVGVAGRGLTFACTAALQLLCTSEQTFVCTPLGRGRLVAARPRWVRSSSGSLAHVWIQRARLGRSWFMRSTSAQGSYDPTGSDPQADTTRQGSVTRHRPSALSHAVSVPRPRARPGQWSHATTGLATLAA